MRVKDDEARHQRDAIGDDNGGDQEEEQESPTRDPEAGKSIGNGDRREQYPDLTKHYNDECVLEIAGIVDCLPDISIVVPIDAEAENPAQATPGALPINQALFRMSRVDKLAGKAAGLDQGPIVDNAIFGRDLIELVRRSLVIICQALSRINRC